jgi:ribose transport system permease protein
VATLVTFIFATGADEAIAPNPIPISSPTFLNISGSTVAGVPIAVIIFVVIALLAWLVLERTYVGRQLYAVGGNPEAARLAGIRINRRIVLAYVVSGACAAVVGIIEASRLTSGTADSVTGWELIAIASAVIGGVSLVGGQGRIIGVVAGAALLVVLRDGLVAINVNAYYQSMVVGVVLLVAIVVDRLRVRGLERSARRAVRPDRAKATVE